MYRKLKFNNMKNQLFSSVFRYVMAVSVLLFSFGLLSCEKTADADGETSFSLKDEKIEISSEGGNIEVLYILENPVSGQAVNVSPDSDWVSESDRKEDGKIILSVAPNTEDSERTCKVTFVYGDLSDELVILQAKAGQQQADSYSIEITAFDETSVTANVTPTNKEQTYAVMYAEKSYYDSLGDEDGVLAADMKYFEEYATVFGMTVEEYLRENLYVGDLTDYRITSLKSDTEYCIYAYSLTAEGEKLSAIFTQTVRTKAVEKVDIFFGINYQIDQSIVTMDVFPSDQEQTYIFDVVAKSDYTTKEALVDQYQQYFNDKLEMYYMFGLTAQDMLNDIASKGPDSYTYKKLKAETDYVGFAIAMNEKILLNSDLFIAEFTTEMVLPSENQIDVKVSDITPTSVKINVTTSNNDQYTCGISEAYEWSGMSDDEIIDELINNGYNLNSSLFEGNVESVIQDLMPGCDYVVFAFGYLGGVATTPLVKVEFSTPTGYGGIASMDPEKEPSMFLMKERVENEFHTRFQELLPVK